jgi:signal transduction histidine kinase
MVTIEILELYKLIESCFELLIVFNNEERIVHASRLFLAECSLNEKDIYSKTLAELLPPSVHEDFQREMILARQGQKENVLFRPESKFPVSIPLRIRYVDLDGGMFCCFGSLIDELGQITDADKEERVKELACLYSVAEWIEVSASVKEFFTELPGYIARGMQYPDYTVVYSAYQGIEYGRIISGEKFIKADLVVNNILQGEIRIGYLENKFDLLPEEQKMLNSIAGMLNLALERKEFMESLAKVKGEEEHYEREAEKLRVEIERKSWEMEDQKKKLGTVNAYLSRLNRDWEDAQNRLATMFQAIPDKVAMIDLKRNVIMTNRTDVDPGNKCHKTFFQRDTPCQDCRLVRVIRDKTPVHIEIKHDDEYYEVHALPIFNQEHEVEGIIEFYRNITREKSYEQQLEQADKLASLGQLVSGIGHEINNPNQFIKGNIKILKQAIEDMLPIVDDYYKDHPDLKIARLKYDFFREHVLTLVNDMAHGSERIKGIVDGLRKFARRDEGQLIDKVDMNTIIDEGSRLVHNQIHKYADIKLNLAPNLPTFIGNSQKLEQVIINLMINAGQAMPEDRRGVIEVSTHKDWYGVVIEVKDDGKGMTESIMKHIFDPFFTTKRAKGGTGLGLSIVYKIIEEHKGTISVSSKPGEGTTFTIRIPATETNTEEPEIQSKDVPGS